MKNSADFRIALFEGDGIGAEITAPTRRLLERVAERAGGFSLSFTPAPAGAAVYRDTGTALPKASLETAAASDAILLAALVSQRNGLHISITVDEARAQPGEQQDSDYSGD